MALATGERVAGYAIEGFLGKGGMGVVYEARQLSLDRTIALKVLSPELSGDEAFRERFRREGLIQARIDHPHIVTVFEAGEYEGSLFLAMRLVRGPTLKELIVRRQLEGARTLRLLTPIADALDAAHEAGLIHRDIKPQNILIAARDHAYLADFGLTKSYGDERSLTQTGQFVGTLDYIAPEQIQGEEASARSDIYSLAAVLYECLTGVVPYPRASDVAVLFAHISDPPPLVTDQRPDLPAALDEVLSRAMDKDAAKRPASALMLMEEATRAFGPRVRAVITPPEPVEVPEEEGVRRPEERVSTVETRIRTVPEERASATAAPQPPPPRARGRAAWVTVAAVVALAVVAGVLAGGSGGSSAHGGATVGSMSAGPLELGLPAGWARPAAAPRIPGLALADPLAAARGTAGVSAGTVGEVGRSLLPRSFVRRLGAEPPRTDRVRLGALSAYRYRDLRVAGFPRPVTVYAAPTSAGVATVACYGAPAARCDQLARGLRLLHGRPLTLGPDAAYARRVDRALGRLDRARTAGVRDLRAARTPAAQARAAAGLQRAHSRAAGELGTTPGPAERRAHTTLAAGLRDGARAWAALGAAAGKGDDAAYARARSAVARADRDVRLALERLRALGYSTKG